MTSFLCGHLILNLSHSFTFLFAPFLQLVDNSDYLDKVLRKEDDIGYDVVQDKWVNMLEAGIIDPVKVTKLAVKHAISVASMILTTKVLVAE